MATKGSEEQSNKDNEELESTAELPLLKEARHEQHSADGSTVVEAGGSEPSAMDEEAAEDVRERPDGLRDVGDSSGSEEPFPPSDGESLPEDSLDDTTDLSDAFSHQATAELPLLDDTTEVGLPPEDVARTPESESAEVEAPDRGETSEVVSAATIERDERKRRTRRNVRIAVAVAIIVVCYSMGVWHYSSHFFPNTTINGMDVSNATSDEAASRLESEGEDFTLKASGAGFELDLDSSEVGYAIDGSSMAQAARAQENAAAWLFGLFQSHEISVPVEANYDDAALTQAVNDAVDDYNSSNMNTSRAYVGYDYSTYEYKVMGSVSGTALSAQDVHDACAEAISNNQTEVEVTDSMVRDATLDDCLELQQVADIANRDCSATISITVNGEEKWSLTNELRTWVSVVSSKISVSQSAIRIWATYYLAPQVAYSDDSGSYTLDVGSMVTTLQEHLEAGDTSAIEAPMNQSSR